MALAGMLIAGLPRYALAVSAVFAALALGTELMAAGRRYAFRKARQAYAVMIGALAVGVAFNILGRTDGPLCTADSPFQGHAAWHVCIAVALGAWGVAAFTARRTQPARPVVAAEATLTVPASVGRLRRRQDAPNPPIGRDQVDLAAALATRFAARPVGPMLRPSRSPSSTPLSNRTR